LEIDRYRSAVSGELSSPDREKEGGNIDEGNLSMNYLVNLGDRYMGFDVINLHYCGFSQLTWHVQVILT
jgi:hypothetical protein